MTTALATPSADYVSDPAGYVPSSTEWVNPGAFEVAPGVFRIPLPMPSDGLKAVNVYAIEDDKKGFTLIDGGWAVAPARVQLEAAFKQLGTTPKSITQILVTHSHRDHYTMAVALRKEFGMPIAIGVGEKQMLTTLINRGLKNFGAQMELLREADADELANEIEAIDRNIDIADGWELPDTWLPPGEIDLGKRRVTVIPTPGHTKGHIVFADPENGVLFAGDHVLPHITPSIGFEGIPSESPLQDFLGSLSLVRKMPDLKLMPAHGPAGSSTHERVDALVAHHDERLGEMLAKFSPGRAETARGIASSVGWTRRKRPLMDLDPFNRMLAICETVAHLRLLVAGGKLTAKHDSSRVVLYALP